MLVKAIRRVNNNLLLKLLKCFVESFSSQLIDQKTSLGRVGFVGLISYEMQLKKSRKLLNAKHQREGNLKDVNHSHRICHRIPLLHQLEPY